MSRYSRSTFRIWLAPLSLLLGVGLTIFVLTFLLDAHDQADPVHVVSLLFHPNPDSAANTLANAGEIVAAVLAIAITVVAIIVELASNRYTHRVTELFVSERINFFVMGLFVVTALQGMWVSITFDYSPEKGGFVPYVGIGLTMLLLTVCLVILLPYFNFVFAYLNPIQIVNRIYQHTLISIKTNGNKANVAERQREAVRGIEQLADVALNAMEHKDKGVSMASVDALQKLVIDYQEIRNSMPNEWFTIGESLARNSDFVSMAKEVLDEVARRQIWFEMKVLRQYQTIYSESLNRMRDINYLISINTRMLALEAIRQEHDELLRLAIKFFNTYLRATIAQRDVRTAYNILNQYRLLAEELLDVREGAYAVEIARYFKLYGQLSFSAELPFILETVAYDLCALNEIAFERKAKVAKTLLKIFLKMDKESEGEVQEASLRGVRKAQIKLASYFLLHGDEKRAFQVYEDMANEDLQRIASIRDELIAVESPEFWEISDRGVNFDYLPPNRRAQLAIFFGWFKNLAPANQTIISNIPGSM
ncbi:MAG: DUF2254 domain-containing protein [Deltaproteobacteria bacterium]|nr:DUF2254 domain-containing protein [Deltaproteobacteria bacterium]